MREIKFRAWSETDHEMIFGYPIILKGVFDSFVQDITGSRWGSEAFKITLMQYTGLKDKNGVEIYEGDILSVPAFYDAVVAFGDYQIGDGYETVLGNGFYLKFLHDGFTDWLHKDVVDDMEVIGNIHQHPELLTTNSV